jgi:hypothetical protein
MRPEDDFTHPVGPEPNFNESMYFHLHDPAREVGGFLRLANRPNEGRGEMTVCLYLPTGRAAFAFARPEVTTNDRFDAAGLRFTVREPLVAIDVEYDGEVHVLDDPETLIDPRAALAASPRVQASVRLGFRGIAPVHDHSFDGGGESFAPNHYEQLVAVTGEIVVGETRYAVDGHGLRDHSWGPRYWQAPPFYRWVHATSADFGFMAAYFASRDGGPAVGGFVWEDGVVHPCDAVEIHTERENDERYQTAVRAVLRGGGREWTVQGTVHGPVVPLRNRRPGADGELQTTRIVEALMDWTLPDGRKAQGMAEYLDQIVDGLPVGLAV